VGEHIVVPAVAPIRPGGPATLFLRYDKMLEVDAAVTSGGPLWRRLGLDLPRMPLGRPGDPGLFGRRSIVWRVARERVLLAGGPAALLLQVAHPLIAAGVAAHSTFGDAPYERLRATLDATLTITFGDREQAGRAAERVRATHRRVRGKLGTAVGPFVVGTAYTAETPELAFWVHATLVESALDAYSMFVKPLGEEHRVRYYEEARSLAELFGAGAMAPATYAGFRRYLRSMNDSLAIGEDAGRLSRMILRPPLPPAVSGLLPLMRSITASLLPRPVQQAYDLRWGRAERALVAGAAASVRASLPLLPDRLRFWPHYRSALRRTGPTKEP
jgi:uncharacterized protein (DUF2236 family)